MRLSSLFDVSVNSALAVLRKRLGLPGPRITPPDEQFLRSQEYQDIMNRHVPWNGQYGLYEAQTYTRSYIHRHNVCARRLGVFRWRGFQEHLDEVLPVVCDRSKFVVDFGGAGCPLGLGSVVVDLLRKDAARRPVPYRSLKDLGKPVDVMFAAHVLEHIQPLDAVIDEMHQVMAPKARLIVMVPAFSNEGWRAGKHHNERFGGHQWTFGLSTTTPPPGLHNYRNIDEAIARRFTIDRACFCGDDSILILAHKAD